MIKKTLLLSIVLVGGVLTPFLASARMMGGWGWGMMGGFGGWSIAGLIIGIVFWVLMVVFIISLIRWVAGGSHSHRWEGKNSAVEILKERYAKGEIKKEEFEEKMKDLMK